MFYSLRLPWWYFRIGGDTEKIQFFLGRAGLREYSHSKDLVYAVLKTVGFNKKFVDGVQLRARTD